MSDDITSVGETRNSKWWRGIYLLAITIVTALFVILVAEYPLVADDLWFSPAHANDNPCGWPETVKDMMRARFSTDMLRLPNLMLPFMLGGVPHIVIYTVIYLLIWLTIAAGCMTVKAAPGNILSYLWMGAFLFLLPWYDYGLVLSYLMNYLFSTFLILCAILIFRRKMTGNPLIMSVYCILFILAGWSHEGFAVPLLCGLGVGWLAEYMPFRNIDRTECAKKLILLIFMGVGILIISLSPVFGTRTEEAGLKLAGMPGWEIMIQLGPSAVLVAVGLGVTVPLLFRNFRNPELLGLVTMGIMAEIIAVIFYNGPRTTWPAVLYSILMIFAALRYYGIGRGYPDSCTGKAITAVTGTGIVGFAVVSLIAGIIEQKKLTILYNEVIAEYIESVTGEVYKDIPTPEIGLSLLKTGVRALNESVPLNFIEKRYGCGKPLILLPEKLKSFEGISVGNRKESDWGDYGLYEGLVIFPLKGFKGNDKGMVTLECEGKRVESRYRAVEFTGEDGEKYIWMRTHAGILNPDLNISGIYN